MNIACATYSILKATAGDIIVTLNITPLYVYWTQRIERGRLACFSPNCVRYFVSVFRAGAAQLSSAQLSIEVACNTLTPRLSTLRWWCCSLHSLRPHRTYPRLRPAHSPRAHAVYEGTLLEFQVTNLTDSRYLPHCTPRLLLIEWLFHII